MSLTACARECMYSSESDCRSCYSSSRTNAARPMANNRRHSRFHLSRMRCFCFWAGGLGSFCPAGRCGLLPRSSLSSPACACRSVGSSPACNFWRKLKAVRRPEKFMQPTLAMELAARFRSCASSCLCASTSPRESTFRSSCAGSDSLGRWLMTVEWPRRVRRHSDWPEPSRLRSVPSAFCPQA